ncbi:MAG: 2Fe-2S iron-sulfur cluster binding domain-containing protein, partial [Candidatus Marinimicrobia bacterium]|nr:2Fe-2S iron-sulfur cluster binding domain-containing protein [Candidatus Neomarinimicrobiota bacterium]
MAIADKKIVAPQDTEINFYATINGELVRLNVSDDSTLLDILRDDLGLTGAKRGCDIGACGSCAVIVNGKALDACI